MPLALPFLLALASPQALRADEPSRLPAVDARVVKGIDKPQRVIVALQDPGDFSRMPAAPERAVTSQPHGRSLRAAVFEQRKAEVLQALRAVPGDAPRVVHDLRPLGMMVLEVTSGHMARLGTLDDVARVWPDVPLEAQLDTSLPYVQAPAFHQSHAGGAGTAVAVIDTPVRANLPAFGSCPSPGSPGCPVKLQLNFASSSLEDLMAREDQIGIGSHGSNVAAVVLGMAPDTSILSLNVFHNDPATGGVIANLSDTLAAMAWVADNAHAYGIVAVNTSLGTYRTDPGACNDSASFGPVRTLHRDHGVLTVTVSGNDALSNAVRDPGCVSSAIAVGALFDQDKSWYSDPDCSQDQPRAGQLACFSNLNGLVDIVAPGVDVSAGGYTMTGTSQAAPHVAGAIAAWQSFHLANDGEFRSAAWMQRNLLANSTSPLVHLDSRSFSQLRMGQRVDWAYAHGFGWWYEELPDNAIPGSNPGLTETLTIDSQPWNAQGAYLYLEVVHPYPEDVQVTLTSPAGTQASFRLPYGQANFTGLVGRTVFPGVFGPIAGAPANGTWTLSLRDTQGNATGHYLQGALYLVREGCTSQCEGQGCGDDRCGGRCGSVCVIDGSCELEGPSANNPCVACLPAVQAGAWTTLNGDACDSGQVCSGPGTCQMGQCVSEPMACLTPGVCEGQGDCDPSTGTCVYAPLADGTTCDDGDGCTEGDTCHEGQCDGVNVCGSGGGGGDGGGSGGPADEVPVQPGAGGSPEATESSGCGCRSATTGASGRGALWFVVVLLVWARRRTPRAAVTSA